MQFTPTQRRVAAWFGIALLTGLVLWLLGAVLTPFVVGAVLAYALAPLVDRFETAWGPRVPRVVSVIVVELAAILALVLLVLLVVPIVGKELPMIREQMPGVLKKLN